MRLKEFNEKVRMIESEMFQEESLDPITYGIRRSIFEQQKLLRLIDAASQTTDSRLAQSRSMKWKRLLNRARLTQARFEKLREEARRNQKVVISVPEPVGITEKVA